MALFSKMKPSQFLMLLAANLLVLGVLSFHQTTDAAPRRGTDTFANPLEQRFEILQEIRKTNRLLAEQNALLRSGQLRVVVQAIPQDE